MHISLRINHRKSGGISLYLTRPKISHTQCVPCKLTAEEFRQMVEAVHRYLEVQMHDVLGLIIDAPVKFLFEYHEDNKTFNFFIDRCYHSEEE